MTQDTSATNDCPMSDASSIFPRASRPIKYCLSSPISFGERCRVIHYWCQEDKYPLVGAIELSLDSGFGILCKMPPKYKLHSVPNDGSKVICAFFNSPEGCRQGKTCRFAHETVGKDKVPDIIEVRSVISSESESEEDSRNAPGKSNHNSLQEQPNMDMTGNAGDGKKKKGIDGASVPTITSPLLFPVVRRLRSLPKAEIASVTIKIYCMDRETQSKCKQKTPNCPR